jgi:caffeoyl-CoA O-methyltransferase
VADHPKSFVLSTELHNYILEHSSPIDAVQEWLIARTGELGPISMMQVAPEQGWFLTMLTRVTRAKFAVEIGTFTGYSSLCIARGLGPNGRLLCCDVSEEWTAIAREAWERAGVDDRVELRLAPATETLGALPADTVIDLAFIDADKPNYAAYYEAVLARLAPDGIIAVDNVLWSGAVLNKDASDENTQAIRAFNDMVAADDRVEAVMLPIADGLTLCRKK